MDFYNAGVSKFRQLGKPVTMKKRKG